MQFINRKYTPQGNASELLGLATGFTKDIEATEVPSIGRGFRTFTKGFFVTDPVNLQSISMSTLEYVPTSLYRKTLPGRYLMNNWNMNAVLLFNDHQEPDASLEIHVFPKSVAVIHGDSEKVTRVDSDLTQADVAIINGMLTKTVRSRHSDPNQ